MIVFNIESDEGQKIPEGDLSLCGEESIFFFAKRFAIEVNGYSTRFHTSPFDANPEYLLRKTSKGWFLYPRDEWYPVVGWNTMAHHYFHSKEGIVVGNWAAQASLGIPNDFFHIVRMFCLIRELSIAEYSCQQLSHRESAIAVVQVIIGEISDYAAEIGASVEFNQGLGGLGDQFKVVDYIK